MGVRIRIPKYLQPKTNGKTTVEVQAPTVGKCIEALIRQYPGLRGEILDTQGVVLLKWMIYLNSQGSASYDELSHPVKDDDTIELVPVAAGG